MGTLWQAKLKEFWAANEFGGTYLLGGILLLGVIVRCSGAARIESWLYSTSPKKDNTYDIDVPGWLLGVTAVSGLIAASVIGCFLYYPAADEQLEELFAVNTNCVLSAKTKDWEAAERLIASADDRSRRLEVGVFLRNGSVDEFKAAKAQTYREKLDKLKELVEQREPQNIDKLAMEVADSYRRMSSAFKEEPEPQK